MKRFQFWMAALFVALLMTAVVLPAPGNAGTMELISKLVDALGITEKQAEGGVGALFNNAKENLSTEDFSKAAEAVPGVDKYMAEAPATDSGGASGLLKSSGLSSLGGSASKIGGMAGLADSFSKLGMNTETMTKFVPIVVDFMESSAGSGVAGLLKGLWQ